MDEKSGMKKKPSSVSARPVGARAPVGRGPAVSINAGPPVPLQNQVQIQAATPHPVDTTQPTKSGGANSGPNVKAYIERQLKSVYDDVLNQPIPDRFLDLLNTLDQGVSNKPETEEKA